MMKIKKKIKIKMAAKMFRRLSSALKEPERKRKLSCEVRGAAIPYPEEVDSKTPDSDLRDPPPLRINGDAVIYRRSTSMTSSSSNGCPSPVSRLDSTDTEELAEWKKELRQAIADGNSTRTKELIRQGHLKVISCSIDEKLCVGALSLLLINDGDNNIIDELIEFLVSSYGAPTCSPFVIVHASDGNGRNFVENVSSCTQLRSFSKTGIASVQLLVLYGQKSEDVAVFFYSILDVPVANTLVLSCPGDVNMKNFHRYESKAGSELLVIIRSRLKSIELIGYQTLSVLVLESCGLSKMAAGGLSSLEHIDLRNNQLTTIPDGLLGNRRIRILRISGNLLRKIPESVGSLELLQELDCSGNDLKRLPPSVVNCSRLRILRCSDNDLVELPLDLGLLSELEELRVHSNRITRLPSSISSLFQLQRLSFYNNPLQNIPSDFPERPGDVRKYFNSLQDHPIKNHLVKLVVVGQEGVGKTTLVKALKKTFWGITRNSGSRSVKKCSGVDVKDIRLDDDFIIRCFDCSGDVDFNETHNFFISPGAIYIVCFNISDYCLSAVETNSFLLGRLQLWLQYICSTVPNAQVVIVGTHADHPSVSRAVLEEIWNQIRKLLAEERENHQKYFREREKLNDCLLCQSDNKVLDDDQSSGTERQKGFVNRGYEAPNGDGEEDGEEEKEEERTVIAFPHIVGYYKVSSVRGSSSAAPMTSSINPGVEGLKEAIRELALRMIRTSPEIPRRWADVRDYLENHVTRNPEDSLMTLEGVARFALAYGVNDREELSNMLQFFRAQGSLLYFPQLCDLQEIVVLDQEWLARIFASVVSSRSTLINELGLIDRNRLKNSWTEMKSSTRDKVLILLRYFGLCFPIDETSVELFPCRLPLGQPDPTVWPSRPKSNQRQVTYSITFPTSIPPPFFNNLMSTVYSYRAAPDDETGPAMSRPIYFANLFLEALRPDSVGCGSCGFRRTGNAEELDLIHQVLFELIPHRRSIQVTSRGALPCCLMKKISKIFVKVINTYKGLQSLTFDSIVCPVCVFENHPQPHRFPWKVLSSGSSIPPLCQHKHSLPDARGILSGSVDIPEGPSEAQSRQDRVRRTDFSGCPRLFVVLPISRDGTTISRGLRLFASSLVFDGYAVHFLCEFPDGYHVTSSLGYRLSNPKEFLKMYGSRVLAILRLLSRTQSDSRNSSMRDGCSVDDVIHDLVAKFPVFKDHSATMTTDALRKYVDEDDGKLRREDLRRMLRLVDQADCFGPLLRTFRQGHCIWVCQGHHRQMHQLNSRSNDEISPRETDKILNNNNNNNRNDH